MCIELASVCMLSSATYDMTLEECVLESLRVCWHRCGSVWVRERKRERERERERGREGERERAREGERERERERDACLCDCICVCVCWHSKGIDLLSYTHAWEKLMHKLDAL